MFSDVWKLPVELSTEETHEYRYCVVVALQQQFPAERRKIIVRRWETHLKPRLVTQSHCHDGTQLERFGELDTRHRVQRGWLAEEMMVQFKLCPGAVTLYKKKLVKPGMKMMVKVTPLVKDNTDASTTDASEDSVDIQDVRARLGVWPIVEAAVREVLRICC